MSEPLDKLISAMTEWSMKDEENPEEAKTLVEAINDIDAPGGSFWQFTPLMHAAQQCCPVTTNIIIKNGAEIDKKIDGGLTALHIAVEYYKEPRSAEVINALLENGADINILSDDSGNTALRIALDQHSDKIELIKMLLDKGADPNFYTKPICKAFPYLENPLQIACGKNNQLVELLLNHGADPNYRDNSCETPMEIAIKRDDLEMMKTLFKHGADANLEGTDGGKTPIVHAAYKGNREACLLIVDHGGDVNYQKEDFLYTALMEVILEAGYVGEPEKGVVAVDILMELGADTNLVDRQDRTALHLAVTHGEKTQVEALLKHGVPVDPALLELAAADEEWKEKLELLNAAAKQ